MKQYVAVNSHTDEAGRITPMQIIWQDGRVFEVDRVTDVRRAPSLRAGGMGIRYTCRIGSRQTYIFYEDPQWFVEAR